MRDAVTALVAMGQLPSEDIGDDGVWVPWEKAVRALVDPATDEEAAAVLDVLPSGEDSAYALAWHLLHFAESAPSWPLWDLLDDRSYWLTFMRERAERGRAELPFSLAGSLPIHEDVPMPVLRALTEAGDSYDDPSEDLLFMLLDGVEHGQGTWMIVERLADASHQTYAQALRVAADSWIVEHREGSPGSHFGTAVGDLRQAHRLLTGWAFELAGGQAGVTWTRVA